MGSIIKVNEYKDFNNNDIITSDGSGNVTINAAAMKNTPAFFAYNSAAVTISDATTTKARLDSEDFDTDSGFDTSTYRYTVPTGAAGKYAIGYGTEARSTGNDIFVSEAYLFKNGAQIAVADMNNNLASNASHRSLNINRTVILDLTAGDYLEVYAYIDCDVPPTNFPTLEGGSTAKSTFMGGYKLIGA